MTDRTRIWICVQCDRRCILIRDEPPVDRLDSGCPWCGLYSRWVEVDRRLDPVILLDIGVTLSDAAGQLMSETIDHLRMVEAIT